MTLFILYFFAIIISFSFKKSKIITLLDFCLMWIMMGWSSGTADYGVYTTRYYNPELYPTLEPIYSFLQNIAKEHGLEYIDFIIILSGLALVIRFFTIYMLTDRINEVLGLWLIFPFIADINQIREFYATSVAFLGLAFFLKMKNRKNGIILACSLCFIAGMIHMSTLLYILLLIPYIFKRKINNYISKTKFFIGTIVLYLLALSGSLYGIGDKVLGFINLNDKWEQTTVAASEAYSSKIFYYIEIILFFILSNFVLKKLVDQSNKFSLLENKVINCTYMFNLLLVLLVLPLVVITPDIYRVQQEFALFIYCVGSYSEDKDFYQTKLICKNNIMIKLCLFILAMTFCWLMCYAVPSLKNGVLLPAFNNNLLIK